MAMPKKRMSHARSSRRRSHLARKPQTLSLCTNCQAPRIPHTVCKACGFYRGRQVLIVKSRVAAHNHAA